VESGVFDTLQISVNIADQESIDLAIPVARAKGMGIIAKRPIGNAVWKHTSKPEPYHQPYWERLPKLNYEFLKGDFQNAVSIALRFTLAVPGVHTAIVGTTQPDRWRQNADLLMKAGLLEKRQFDEIRARWKSVAGPDWNGQT
jgi:aryl-alcohol dehydrogenase-like predicted oxidoreductase